jgi:hypothetical protein
LPPTYRIKTVPITKIDEVRSWILLIKSNLFKAKGMVFIMPTIKVKNKLKLQIDITVTAMGSNCFEIEKKCLIRKGARAYMNPLAIMPSIKVIKRAVQKMLLISSEDAGVNFSERNLVQAVLIPMSRKKK